MNDLSSSEDDRNFDLVTIPEEAKDMFLLKLIIVLIGLRSEFDLFDLDMLLLLLRLMLFFLLLVHILAMVHDLAYRRLRCRRDLYEVKSPFISNSERLRDRHDPKLGSSFINDPDLPGPDLVVNPLFSLYGVSSYLQ